MPKYQMLWALLLALDVYSPGMALGAQAITADPSNSSSTVARTEADRQAARAKSMQVLAALYNAKAASSVMSYGEIKKLKLCAGLPDTDTRSIFSGHVGKQPVWIVEIKGERSGAHVLFGSNCSTLAVLTDYQAVTLSYIADAVSKKLGTRVATKTLLPTRIPKTGESRSSDDTMTYEGGLGTISITKSQDKTNLFDATLVNKQGVEAYRERFEFKD
jgi:hypothetical protein